MMSVGGERRRPLAVPRSSRRSSPELTPAPRDWPGTVSPPPLAGRARCYLTRAVVALSLAVASILPSRWRARRYLPPVPARSGQYHGYGGRQLLANKKGSPFIEAALVALWSTGLPIKSPPNVL